MVAVAVERGYAGASVSAVCARAGMSRQAFYEQFSGREECFVAVLGEGRRRTCERIERTFEHARDWRGGLRLALAALLVFADEERALARVCVVESAAAGAWALAERQRNVARIAAVVVERWPELRPREPHAVATTGAMASVLDLVQHRLLSEPSEPMVGLLGALAGLAFTPYLDWEEVGEQVWLADELAGELLSGWGPDWLGPALEADGELPAVLAHPRARRARECLLCLAERPGASNRDVAVAVGIGDHAQSSRLLGQLEREGLLVKRAAGAGRPNAWWLTAYGEEVVALLRKR